MSDSLDQLIDEFPEPVQDAVAEIWATLPTETRSEFQGVVSQLPQSVKPLKDVLDFVLDQYKPVFGNKRSIAIIGPANVGKSTLYNQLVSRKEDEAEVGPIPGTTRENQTADSGPFTIMDTPGADAVGEVGERERQIALQAAGAADFLVIMFEATRGIKRYERDLFDTLLAFDKPFVVVLNKIDLIPKKSQADVLASAARNLRLEPGQIIDTVATEGTNVGQVILAIVKLEPELLAALAEALPEYRSRLSWQRILPAASAAGAVGLIPLPFVDLLPLLGIQTGLVLSLARIYGFEITLARAKELIATFGIGMIARTVYQQLSKVLGAPGWVLSASIAAATTVTIGYGAMVWFAHGERPTQDALKKTVIGIASYLRDQLITLGTRKPNQETLRQRISQALQDLPSQLRPNKAEAGPAASTEPRIELMAEASEELHANEGQ
ncbi:MAG: 50S ribosome-binding GTPase [Anaerolineae bacterium]|jgi:small GTP-binding protein